MVFSSVFSLSHFLRMQLLIIFFSLWWWQFVLYAVFSSLFLMSELIGSYAVVLSFIFSHSCLIRWLCSGVLAKGPEYEGTKHGNCGLRRKSRWEAAMCTSEEFSLFFSLSALDDDLREWCSFLLPDGKLWLLLTFQCTKQLCLTFQFYGCLQVCD